MQRLAEFEEKRKNFIIFLLVVGVLIALGVIVRTVMRRNL
jgi:hypothetical protein